jgi:hypothetical protein
VFVANPEKKRKIIEPIIFFFYDIHDPLLFLRLGLIKYGVED